MRRRRKNERLGEPAAPPGPAPVVAVVGRPNVGKSTLVNRLCRKSVAIVADQPGMTRDRVYAETRLRDRPVVLVDTGGFDVDPEAPYSEHIRVQLAVAVEEADVVVCLFDGAASPTTHDEQVVDLLRRSGKPVVHAANKTESERHRQGALEYHELGVEEILAVSAAHGQGIGELVDAIVSRLPEPAPAPPPEELTDCPRLAIMGRPNAGKSTLVNTLLGEDRMIVDDRPGTTRDAIQHPVTYRGRPYVLIDTAGMRRKRSVQEEVEELSVLHAVKAMSVADVVLLLVDATSTVAEQDLRIANLALRRGRGLVVGMNKMDALETRPDNLELARPYTDAGTLEHVPVLGLAGKTGWKLRRVLETVERIWLNLKRRIPTPELNDFLEAVVRDHQPPAHHHRPVRLNYITQVESSPPTFVVFVNHPHAIGDTYKRYVENRLRQAWDFQGVPIVLSFRKKGSKKGEPGR